MSFLKTHCSLSPVFEPKDLEGFHCGDHDIDEFFTNDCFGFTTQLLGKTYCYRLNEEPNKVVCAFTIANAGIRVSDLPNARKKKGRGRDTAHQILERLSCCISGKVGSVNRVPLLTYRQ